MERWSGGSGPITHLLLNGGVLHASNASPEVFHSRYVESLKRNKKLYLVEQKTPVFRFFVDLDYKDQTALPHHRIIELCQAMNEVTGQACLIALSRPRQVGGLIKTGVHIHWPDLHVTKQQAMQYRTKILLALSEGFPGRDWSKDIDAAVYLGAGLRMLWSYKTDADSSPYIPWKRVGASVTDLPADPAVDLLNLFSIRLDGVEEKTCQDLPESADKLEEFIRRNIQGQSDASVQRVFKVCKETDKAVYCVQTNSKYCENISAEHRSNHIWFSIYRKLSQWTIRQKCLDPDCNADSSADFTFTGKPYILPPSIVEELTKDGIMAQDTSSSVSLYDIFSISPTPRRAVPDLHQ